jgi:hypothetical protein
VRPVLDPDLLAHQWHQDLDLHWSYLFINNLMNQKVNSLDPDQTPICWLIWIYTVRPCNKGVSMEERVKTVQQAGIAALQEQCSDTVT